nr:RNA-directed DNA polymerase, eukaryota [Tanacetum cinerariifolium]
MMLASLHAWLVTQMDPKLTSSFYLFGTNSKGKRFGFVRFIKVLDVDRLVNNLCTVWVGRHKLQANILKFQREPLKRHNSLHNIDGVKSGNSGDTYNSNGVKGAANPYAHVVKGSQNSKMDSDLSLVMVLDDSYLNEKDYSLYLIGKIQLASSDFNTDGTVTWVEIEDFMEDNDEEEVLKVGSYEEVPNGEDVKNVEDLKGDSDREIAPDTKFEEDFPNQKGEEDSVGQGNVQSEDTFNIYELLNHKRPVIDKISNSKESLKYPPGYTPTGSKEATREKQFDSNFFSKNDVEESICSGHFKKSEVPKSGGFILQLIDDLVKVGETMSASVGNSGGFLCVWDPNMFKKTNSTVSDYFVMVRGDWMPNGEVVIMGDFNEVRNKLERFGTLFNRHGADVFNRFISNAGLEEVPLKGTEVVNLLQEVKKKNSLEAAQKAKIKWVTKGDENSKYYHGVINKKKNQLSIRGILVEGTWIDSPSLMKISKEEIKKAVWDCGIDKSPGPDGFTFGSFSKGGISSFIILIPKTPNANMVNRPISLIGSMYKIISKILANHLVVVLGDLVNEIQSAFMADKQILDVDVGLFKGIELAPSLNLSHIFYVNDAIFMGQWSESNIDTIVKVLDCFNRASGLRINMTKSLEGSGEFTITSVKKMIDDFMLPEVSSKTRWIKAVPVKLNMHAWKVKVDGLPTRLNISRRGIDIESILCPMCGKAVESTSHIFFTYKMSKEILRKISRWLNVAKNLKNHSQAPRGVSVGLKGGFKPVKQVYRLVSKKNNANTSRNKKKDAESKKEVSNLNSFEVLYSVKNDVDLGTNDETSDSKEANSSRSSFWNVGFSSTSTTLIVEKIDKFKKLMGNLHLWMMWDEVEAADNEMISFLASEKVGYGTNSTLEQWRDTY